MKTSSTSPVLQLWPDVELVMAFRPPEEKIIAEIPRLSERPLLLAIAYAIHHEMRVAGQWAAYIDSPGDDILSHAKDSVRSRVQNAARLLALYTALRNVLVCPRDSDPTPDAMREAATRSYYDALREARPCAHSTYRRPAKKALAVS